MVHNVGRAAGWSTAGLYAVSRRRKEQSAGNRENLFQDLADFFFFSGCNLQGTAASRLFLKTV